MPLGCHAVDADSAEGKAPLVGQRRSVGIDWQRFVGREAVPVVRRLEEGDRVAGFTVYHLPGHTQGHIALLRESDRVAALVGV